MWAELLNQPENRSSSQTDISSRNLSHPNPQKSYTLDNGQCKSTNEYSEYNPLAMRLCYVLVLTCTNPTTHQAAFTVHHSKAKMQQHYDNACKNSSPAATKIYCTFIRLLQV